MNYYVQETPYAKQMRGAWGKAHGDINIILSNMGYKALEMPKSKRNSLINRAIRQGTVYFRWKKLLKVLEPGDTLVVQHPPLENTVLFPYIVKRADKMHIKVILIIHDLASLLKVTFPKKIIFASVDRKVFAEVDHIIAHNESMIRKLADNTPKMIPLEIFDYLIDGFDPNRADKGAIRKDLPIIIAGNLNPQKTGYLYDLPEDCQYNVYGVGFIDEGKENIHYMGSFPPEDLPYVLSGSFGLVWDGDSGATCSGIYGEYMKINNPHKTSLYLASGVPVIIWREAAMADFILKNHCGIAVDSLSEIAPIIRQMTEEEYEELKRNAGLVGERLRSGYYMRNAIQKAISG